MALLDNLEIKATGSVSDALSKIDQLVDRIESISSVKRSVNISTSFGDSQNQIKNLQNTISRLNAAITATAKRVKNFDFANMQFPESSFLSVTHMANAYTDLEYAARQAYVAMEAAHNIGSLAMPENITKLSDAIDNLSGKVGKMKTEVAHNARQAQREIDNSAKESEHSISLAHNVIADKLSNLFASIKRIAFYRVIRSAIKAVTQGFQEGIRNAYQWAVENNHAFQQVMDTYATKSLYLKNTLGALASTVLTALLPSVESLVNAFVWGTNIVNEFIAAITGQSSFLMAKEVATVFADSVENATKKQKELNQQLMAFDELNVITTPRNNGRGADELLDLSDAFEEVNVSEKMQSIADAIKNAIPLIGTTIAENLPGILAGIGAAAMFTTFFGGAIKTALSNALFGGGGAEGVQSIINSLMNNKVFTFVVGLGAIIGGVFLSNEAGKALANGEVFKGIAEGIGGAIAAAIGGKFLAATFGISSGLGITMGAELSVVVTLASWVFNTEKGKAFIEGVGEEIESILTTGKGTAGETVNGIPKFQKNSIAGFEFISDTTNRVAASIGMSTNKSYVTPISADDFDQSPIIKKYAGGGLPEMGSVFVAGEVPGQAEMVGNINGRTGVASGQEITGIADAVYATGNEEANLLRELVAVVKAGGGSMQPSAAFGRFASQSIRLYKGVTG